MSSEINGKAEDLAELVLAIKRAITVAELAQFLNVSPRLIYRMVQDAAIPAIWVCGCIRFSPAALAEWLREKSGSRVLRKRASSPMKDVAKSPSRNPVKKTYIKVS